MPLLTTTTYYTTYLLGYSVILLKYQIQLEDRCLLLYLLSSTGLPVMYLPSTWKVGQTITANPRHKKPKYSRVLIQVVSNSSCVFLYATYYILKNGSVVLCNIRLLVLLKIRASFQSTSGTIIMML